MKLTLWLFKPSFSIGYLLGAWICWYTNSPYCHAGYSLDDDFYQAAIRITKSPSPPPKGFVIKTWEITNPDELRKWSDSNLGDFYNVEDLLLFPWFKLFPRWQLSFKKSFICSMLAADAIRMGKLADGSAISICGDVPAYELSPGDLAKGALA